VTDLMNMRFYDSRNRLIVDSCLMAVVEPRVLATYEVIRRYVYTTPGEDDIKMAHYFGPAINHIDKGVVTAHVSQQRMTALIGLSRQNTVSGYVQVLKELGWIKSLGPKSAMLYGVGTWDFATDAEGQQSDSSGGASYWMDEFVTELMRYQLDRAARDGNSTKALTSIDPVHRVTWAKEFVLRRGAQKGKRKARTKKAS
jgi:hypothetical protein